MHHVMSQVLDSMMNRTIGSSSEQPTSVVSTSANGSAGTTVTSVTTESVMSSQPVVSSSQPVVSGSQPVVSTPSVAADSEEVRSKLSATNKDQSSSKDDQPVPMATNPPTEGNGSSDNKVAPTTAPDPPAEERRRPRLTIRLVHRPRGAPRCKCYH